jgi:hypothetical protein
MKKTLLACALALGLAGGVALAKDGPALHGKIASMSSVPCGTQQKRHKKSREMLCQEYVLQTDSMEYHIRQPQEKHTELLPIGQEAEFRIEKDKIKLRVPGTKGKEREYVIVSATAR